MTCRQRSTFHPGSTRPQGCNCRQDTSAGSGSTGFGSHTSQCQGRDSPPGSTHRRRRNCRRSTSVRSDSTVPGPRTCRWHTSTRSGSTECSSHRSRRHTSSGRGSSRSRRRRRSRWTIRDPHTTSRRGSTDPYGHRARPRMGVARWRCTRPADSGCSRGRSRGRVPPPGPGRAHTPRPDTSGTHRSLRTRGAAVAVVTALAGSAASCCASSSYPCPSPQSGAIHASSAPTGTFASASIFPSASSVSPWPRPRRPCRAKQPDFPTCPQLGGAPRRGGSRRHQPEFASVHQSFLDPRSGLPFPCSCVPLFDCAVRAVPRSVLLLALAALVLLVALVLLDRGRDAVGLTAT